MTARILLFSRQVNINSTGIKKQEGLFKRAPVTVARLLLLD
jgi:hypothetical protein